MRPLKGHLLEKRDFTIETAFFKNTPASAVSRRIDLTVIDQAIQEGKSVVNGRQAKLT